MRFLILSSDPAISDYTGVTIISNGVVALSGAGVLSGPTNYITVVSGAKFDVSGLTTPFTLAAGQTLGGNGVVTGDVAMVSGLIAPGLGSTISTLNFSNNLSLDGISLTTTNLFKLSSGVNDQIFVAGNLTLNGVIALRVVPTGPLIPNGNYVLYRWGGNLTGDASNFAVEYSAQPGTFTITTNLVTKQIILQVTGVPSANNLVWRGDGAANAWDYATLNWRNGGSASLFNNGDKATFDDSGSNNVPVDITTGVSPSGVLFNATKPYVLGSSAAAGVSGTISLLKSNTGVLTVTSDNTYSGGTLIAGGVLQVGDGSISSGSLGAGAITNNSQLVYNRPDTITVDPIITGSGQVVQNGSATLTLNKANSYSGGTTISNGIVHISNAAALQGLGTGTVNLSGGTLRVASGLGFSAATGVSNNLNVVEGSTLEYDGTGTFGCVLFGAITGASGKMLTLNSPSGSSLNRLRQYGAFTCNADINLSTPMVQFAPYTTNNQVYNGIISGPGQVISRGAGTFYFNNSNTFTGNFLLSNGSVGVGVNSTSASPPTIDNSPLGAGSLVLAVESGFTSGSGSATLFASGGPRVIENPITYQTGTNILNFIVGGSSNLTLSGTFSLAGSDGTIANRVIQVDNSALTTFAGVMSDNGLVGGFTKIGAGTLALSAVNSYTGPTEVGAGTLLVNGQIDVGAVTVTNGALGGTGTILGAVTINSPGTLSPGASIGTLTINNNLTLNGNLFIELKRSLSPAQSNDVTVVSGTLNNTGTGTLTVTNLDATPLVAGNRFVLFSKPVVNGNALVVTGGNVTWTNHLALDGSIIAGPAVVSQPPVFTSTAIIGNNIVLSGTNGVAGNPFNVLSSTNLTTPRASWTLETSGTFGTGGGFNVSIPVSSTTPAKFYLLQLP